MELESLILNRIDFDYIFSLLSRVDKHKNGQKFKDLEVDIKDVKTLGLQVPDGLKYWAREIVEKLREEGFEVIISSSPTYGACDVDTELLKYVDYLIHIGHTKLLDVDRVIYVPYRVDYKLSEDALNLLKESVTERRIAIIGTANYAWKFQEIKMLLEKEGYEVILRMGRNVEYPGQVLGCNYSVLDKNDSDAILFIGDGIFHPLGAAIYSGKKVYRYSPLTNEFEIVKVEDFLKKRYSLIARASGCENFCILVSCKEGQNRISLARKILSKIEEKGRRGYILLTNEIKPEVIESFNFDCYVNTACPRIAYDDWKTFKKPLITPQELEIALGIRKDYILDRIY